MSTELKSNASVSAFPSGDSRPIAVLADEPVALERRYQLRFTEGLDVLDRFRYATIDLGECCQGLLHKHFGDPNPGTVGRIDSDADPKAARRELTAKLALTENDVLWWSTDA